VSSAAYRDGAGHPTYEFNRNWSPENDQLMQIGRQHVGLFSSAPFTLEHLPQDRIRAPFLERVIAVL
jgi:hypothetical protein